MGWVKGQSGNPKGRPKNAETILNALFLEAKRDVKVGPNERIKRIHQVARAIFDKAADGDLDAAKFIADRLDGPLERQVSIRTEHEHTHTLNFDKIRQRLHGLDAPVIDAKPEPANGESARALPANGGTGGNGSRVARQKAKG